MFLPIRKSLRLWIAATFISAVTAIAAETAPKPASVCAVIEEFGGKVQVLDPNRTTILDIDVRSGIPCGSWISTEDGFFKIIHRDGYRVTAGSSTFLEVVDDQVETVAAKPLPLAQPLDQLVLYKGQLKVQAGAGVSSGELKIVTPHARARIKRGRAILIFSKEQEETQLITLDQVASLENRFESSRAVRVKEGEASSLNFKALRVLPSIPQAVSLSGLKQKLIDLRLDDRTRHEVLGVVKGRQERKFATVLDRGQGHSDDMMDYDRRNAGAEIANRKPSALEFQTGEYRRHPPKKDDEVAKTLWTRRLVGDQTDGEKILYPDRFYGKAGAVNLQVRDPNPEKKITAKSLRSEEEAEKEKLLRELSSIRVE
ncbi:MAG: hypothetical protein JNL01_00840 [Bdellovibrionales bacterium]|nr:hypothetical protein [Bdellovibrionales bacterium]